jgi:SNF2 family DNA or RNA helicase
MSQVFDVLAQIRKQGDNLQLPIPSNWNRDYSLRKYQRVGSSHLLALRRFVIGDTTGSGKTIQALYAWGVFKDHHPSRLIIITTKSAVSQWGEEVGRFLPGTPCFRVDEGSGPRSEIYEGWIRSQGGAALILNWNVWLRDSAYLTGCLPQWFEKTWIIADEAQKLKNPRSQVYRATQEISQHVRVIHGLTATLMKNRAHDAFYIFQLLMPGVMSKAFFEHRYCIYSQRRVPLKTGKGGGRHWINVKYLDGYRDLDDFSRRMSTLYLARTDADMDLERPSVQHIFRSVEMSVIHRKIYREAEKGLFTEDSELDSLAARSAISQAQIAANTPENFVGQVWNFNLGEGSARDFFHPEALEHPDYDKIQKANSKLSLLKDILENDLENEPVIIYSPFSTTVNHLAHALSSYNPVFITGDTSVSQREEFRHRFQEGKTNIILLTDAGGEALNLQRASHVILYSRPWDPGRYVQVVGRARRFGSPHRFLGVWHLTVKDSVDEYVDSVLTSKVKSFAEITNNPTSLPELTSSLPLEVVRAMRKNRLK